jgi:hypothetical protein
MNNEYNLVLAVWNNDLAAVAGFLNFGGNPNAVCSVKKVPILFIAIDNFSPDMCRLLCERGASLDGIVGKISVTPLDYLLIKICSRLTKLDHHKLQIINILLSFGTNPDYGDGIRITSRRMLNFLGIAVPYMQMDIEQPVETMVVE